MTSEELRAYLEALLPNVAHASEANAIKRALGSIRQDSVCERKAKKRDARIVARAEAILAKGTIEEIDSLARLSRDQGVLRRIALYNKHPQNQSAAVRKVLCSPAWKSMLRGAMVRAATRLESPREVMAIIQWWRSRREKYPHTKEKNRHSALYILTNSPCLTAEVLRVAICDGRHDVNMKQFFLIGVSDEDVLKDLIETAPEYEIRVRALERLVSVAQD